MTAHAAAGLAHVRLAFGAPPHGTGALADAERTDTVPALCGGSG